MTQERGEILYDRITFLETNQKKSVSIFRRTSAYYITAVKYRRKVGGGRGEQPTEIELVHFYYLLRHNRERERAITEHIATTRCYRSVIENPIIRVHSLYPHRS